MKLFCYTLVVSILLLTTLVGCGGTLSNLVVGQKLYMSDHSEFGTTTAVEENHQFPNGAVEPGVLIDFGPRIPGTPQWLPARSAQRMAQ